MFLVAPPQLGYSYYNPYGGQFMMPPAGGFYPYPFAAGLRYPSVDQGMYKL